MEIKIQIKGRVFSISFGRKTKWFESVYWFSVIEEWYHHREVIFAKIIIKAWRQ